MLDFIMVPTVMAIICAGIYGLFELFVRRNERMAIIEKIGDKLDASAFEGKLGLPSYTKKYSFSRSYSRSSSAETKPRINVDYLNKSVR